MQALLDFKIRSFVAHPSGWDLNGGTLSVGSLCLREKLGVGDSLIVGAVLCSPFNVGIVLFASRVGVTQVISRFHSAGIAPVWLFNWCVCERRGAQNLLSCHLERPALMVFTSVPPSKSRVGASSART